VAALVGGSPFTTVLLLFRNNGPLFFWGSFCYLIEISIVSTADYRLNSIAVKPLHKTFLNLSDKDSILMFSSSLQFKNAASRNLEPQDLIF
jgi:hypothetical protein